MFVARKCAISVGLLYPSYETTATVGINLNYFFSEIKFSRLTKAAPILHISVKQFAPNRQCSFSKLE